MGWRGSTQWTGHGLRARTGLTQPGSLRTARLGGWGWPGVPRLSRAEALPRWASVMWIAVAAKLGGHHEHTLTPRQFMLTIAKRGGYLGWKHDPRPGWKVLWLGGRAGSGLDYLDYHVWEVVRVY